MREKRNISISTPEQIRQQFPFLQGNILPESISIPHLKASATVIELSPRPETAVDGPPVVLFPGLGLLPTSYEGLVTTLVNRGRKVILIQHTQLPEVKVKGKERATAELAAETQVDSAILEKKGITKFHGLAHSRGALLLSGMNPDSLRSRILISPAGFMPKEHSLVLTARFLTNSLFNGISIWVSEREEARRMRIAAKDAMATLRSTPRRAIRQGLNIAQVDVATKLAQTKRTDNSEVPTLLLIPEYDMVFFPRQLLRQAELLGVEYKRVRSRRNGHSVAINDPFMMAEEILTFLEKVDEREKPKVA